jgi:hypothetical protein
MALPVWNTNSDNYPIAGGAAIPVKLIGTQLSETADNTEVLLHHIHNFEIWYGLLTPAAGGKVAQENMVPFRVTTGAGAANTFGTAVQIMDTNDTPVSTGATKFDIHRIFVFNVQTSRIFRLRIVYSYNPRTGAVYATAADAIAARNYSNVVFKVDAVNADAVPLDIIGARVPSGTKIWIAAASDSAIATWIDFQFGFHEYGD